MGRFLLLGLTVIGIALSSCDSPSDIGGGFTLVDGGGSKLSLSKDGNIIINYTVTGMGFLGRSAILENRSYGAPNCDYYVLDPHRGTMGRLKIEPMSETARKAIGTVQMLNERSCKAEGHRGRL
jgi:hypothetical protein